MVVYKCEKCGETYPRLDWALDHVEEKHEGQGEVNIRAPIDDE